MFISLSFVTASFALSSFFLSFSYLSYLSFFFFFFFFFSFSFGGGARERGFILLRRSISFLFFSCWGSSPYRWDQVGESESLDPSHRVQVLESKSTHSKSLISSSP